MIPCRLCLWHQPEDAQGIEATLRAYLDALPEEARTDDAAYAARLAKCEGCSHLRGYTCALCGCYVQARAAKRHMACPDADARKWEAL